MCNIFFQIFFFNRIEEIVLFISYHDTVYLISFIPEDSVVLCKTAKLSLNNHYFGRLFHPSKCFSTDKKKYVVAPI